MRQEAVFVHLVALTQLFPGKWVYEVLISSQGLMQIGWCTISCRFNQEVHIGEGTPPWAQGELLLPQASSGLQIPSELPRTLTNLDCPLEKKRVPPNPRHPSSENTSYSFPQIICSLL